MVFCTGCAGCGCVELGCELRALCEGYCPNTVHTVHAAHSPTPHNHSQHNQCRTPYAVIHSLVLLKMGMKVPETCWDRSLIINTRLVASCWFLFLHPTFMLHGHKSLKKQTVSHFNTACHITCLTEFLTGPGRNKVLTTYAHMTLFHQNNRATSFSACVLGDTHTKKLVSSNYFHTTWNWCFDSQNERGRLHTVNFKQLQLTACNSHSHIAFFHRGSKKC